MIETLGIAGTAARDLEPSTEAGEAMLFSWVPDDRIPRRHRQAVRRNVDRVARSLGLGSIRVRYFGPASVGADFTGHAPEPGMVPGGVTPDDQPLTIGLLASLRGPALAAVIAHEVRHVYQLVTGTRQPSVTYGVKAELLRNGVPFAALHAIPDGRPDDHAELDADDFAARYIGAGA